MSVTIPGTNTIISVISIFNLGGRESLTAAVMGTIPPRVFSLQGEEFCRDLWANDYATYQHIVLSASLRCSVL